MKTSIATVSISGELPEKLEAIARAGFDGVEIFENDFLAFDGSPADVGRMARDLGLEITLFQPFRDFEGMRTGLGRGRSTGPSASSTSCRNSGRTWCSSAQTYRRQLSAVSIARR